MIVTSTARTASEFRAEVCSHLRRSEISYGRKRGEASTKAERAALDLVVKVLGEKREFFESVALEDHPEIRRHG